MKPFGHCNYKRSSWLSLGKWKCFLQCALPIDCDYTTPLRLFLQIYIRNMAQTPSILTTEQQTSLLILTIPEELFTIMASFMDTESQLAFAHTCKTVYAYHKQQCKEETFTLVCDPQCDKSLNSQYIKALERCMSQTGWAGVKVTLKIVSVDPQNNYDHPIRALCLNESFQLPNGLDCASLNALIISFSLKEIMPNISFLEKFSNLKSLRLKHVIINDDTMSMLSKLPLLKFISLSNCKMTKVHLSKIFEGCTTLEEIQLLYCNYSDVTSIKLPPQLKRFEIKHYMNHLDK